MYDTDKYRDAFQHQTQAFELTWKDVIIVIQIFSSLRRQRVLEISHRFTDNIYHAPENIPG